MQKIDFLKFYVINTSDNLPFQPYYNNPHLISFQKIHVLSVVQFMPKKMSATELCVAFKLQIKALEIMFCEYFCMYRVRRENPYTSIIFWVVWIPQRCVIRRSNGNFVGFSRMIIKMVKNYVMKHKLHFSGLWQNWQMSQFTRYW